MKLPGVLVQVAAALQPPLFTAHSSISTSSQGNVEWNSWTEVRQVQYGVRENKTYYYCECSEVVLLLRSHYLCSKRCLMQNCVHEKQTSIESDYHLPGPLLAEFRDQLFRLVNVDKYETPIFVISHTFGQTTFCIFFNCVVKIYEFWSDWPAQLNPSPLYPGRQVHLKLPMMLAQVASELQFPLFVVHSSIPTSSEVELRSHERTAA